MSNESTEVQAHPKALKSKTLIYVCGNHFSFLNLVGYSCISCHGSGGPEQVFVFYSPPFNEKIYLQKVKLTEAFKTMGRII